EVVRRLTQLAHDACVAFDGLFFIEANTLGVSLDETPIKDSAGQAFVVVAFDCFEVAHGNARLIGNLTQWQASLFSCEPPLFTDSSHRYQSASPWRLVSIAFAMPVREEYQFDTFSGSRRA